MKNYSYLFLIGICILAQGCAKIYYSPDARTISNSHQIIAIVPPQISIAAMRKVDPEAIKEQQRTESLNFQKEIYSWLLKRKMQGRIFVEIQDVETTNTILTKAGYFAETPMTPVEISESLQVDGIITSNFALTKPLTETEAIVLGLLIGVWGPTNQVTVTMSIHDAATKKMFWNFNYKVSGSSFSSVTQLVNQIMRKASKKMPYMN